MNEKTGKYPLTFNPKNAHPWKQPVVKSCGKCESCRRQHVTRIATACEQHMRLESASCYLTLTYDEEHLPENGTLVKKHVDRFIDALRKWIAVNKDDPKWNKAYFGNHQGKFKRVVSGEYGSKTDRPHYHLFIMGFDFPDKEPLPFKKDGKQLFRSKILQHYWPYGTVDYKNADPGAAKYVIKYAMKEKLHGKEYHEQYEQRGLALPFVSVSQGIGAEYAQKYQEELFRNGTFISDGKEVALNRRQLQQLARIDPERTEQYKEERRKKQLEESIPKEYYYPDPFNMGVKWELNMEAASQYAIRKELVALSLKESASGLRSEEYRQLQSMLDPELEQQELRRNAELQLQYEERLNRLTNPKAVESKKQNDQRKLDIQRKQDESMLKKWRKSLRS